MAARSRIPQLAMMAVGGGIYLMTLAGFVVGGLASLYPPEHRDDIKANPLAAVLCFGIAVLLVIVPVVYSLIRLRQSRTDEKNVPSHPSIKSGKRKKKKNR